LLPPGSEGWTVADLEAIRGITVGPIENALHPDAGYGTAKGRAALEEARAMGATWVAITPFGRVWDLEGVGVGLVFEAPLEQNTRDIERTIDQAHAAGLKVMLVPHLWVEKGGWRALIDPGDDAGWTRWSASYRRFLLHWTEVAQAKKVDLLSVGVELRSWVTTSRVASFRAIIEDVRARYDGPLTYSANWDDVAQTLIWDELDLIGINAFYPLTKKEDARYVDLAVGARAVAADLAQLASTWQRPVVLTEMGYTTRIDPALRPWEWPDKMSDVTIDERAQAIAYRALLAPLVDEPWCAGFFVWRTYADPQDVSQEAEWGFSPRGKMAELVLRDAFITTWAADDMGRWGTWAGLLPLRWTGDHETGYAHAFTSHRRWGGQRARTPGIHAWELAPAPASLFVE
jgi:hypothetical protein